MSSSTEGEDPLVEFRKLEEISRTGVPEIESEDDLPPFVAKALRRSIHEEGDAHPSPDTVVTLCEYCAFHAVNYAFSCGAFTIRAASATAETLPDLLEEFREIANLHTKVLRSERIREYLARRGAISSGFRTADLLRVPVSPRDLLEELEMRMGSARRAVVAARQDVVQLRRGE